MSGPALRRWCGLAVAAAMAAVPLRAGVRQRWVFSPDRVRGDTVEAIEGGLTAKGERPLTLAGSTTVFSGDNSLSVEGVSARDLPTKVLTAEAWVMLERPLRWGCVVGYIQDNGSYEKGWYLGYENDRLAFHVSTGPKLIAVFSRKPFERGRWYHLVGTYDGASLKLYVDGRLQETSAAAKGAIDYPPDAFFMVGAYRDKDEFYRMHGALGDIAVYDHALTGSEIRERSQAPPPGITLVREDAVRPWVRFTGPASARLSWAGPAGGPVSVQYGRTEALGKTLEAAPHDGRYHVDFGELAPEATYYYRLVSGSPDGERRSRLYELDTTFNYVPHPVSRTRAVPVSDSVRAAAGDILTATGVGRGLCVVYGSLGGELAHELALETEMTVVVLDDDASRVAATRQRLYRAGAYGQRVSVRHVESLTRTPISDCLADLVVSEPFLAGHCVGAAEEAYRILRPGGSACFVWGGDPGDGALGTWLAAGRVPSGTIDYSPGSRQALIRRAALPGAGEWTHQYGRASNCAYGGEALAGASATSDLGIQWIGRPGADFGLDRNPRMPAPLCAGGRLFHQGMNRIIALNAYNGMVLWGLEVPDLRRVNIPRDASNWCADESSLYVVVRESLWCVDAATGRLSRHLELPSAVRDDHEWGYVAEEGGVVFGSSVRSGGSYTEFWGGNAWYDHKDASCAAKVCSDALFAYRREDLGLLWLYRRGVIINTTIAVDGGTVFFVESRNTEAVGSGEGRLSSPCLWRDQFLVALDVGSGRVVWERPLDTVDGTVVFFLVSAPEALVLVSSNKRYHLYAFRPRDGAPMWEAGHAWPGKDHSAHMQHPVVVDGVVYLEPKAYGVKDGAPVAPDMGKREGCHTYLAGGGALIYRGQGRCLSMWDRRRGAVSSWPRLRPSCWLSVIPAGGMLLAPEGGGGCSCGGWLETSVGFLPNRHRSKSPE